MPDGRYYAWSVSTNGAGLQYTSASVMFLVNNEAPEIQETNTVQLVYLSGANTFVGYSTNIAATDGSSVDLRLAFSF